MSASVRNAVWRINRKHRWLSFTKPATICRRCCTLHGSDIRVRFAPSPTGQMHLGGLRTALYNYLFAKSKNGVFILRVEDTDRKRTVEGAEKNILSVLRWAGLHPDEGPGIGGIFGPYRQTERQELYNEYAEQMLESGHAYRCFCTVKRLDLLQKEQLRQGEATGYDNKCRNLTQEEIQEKLDKKIPYVLRFKYEPITEPCPDLIHKQTNTKLVGQQAEGDFIIVKTDNFPTYHFANVVDDHLMKISHVLRGEEWSISTPKHLQMYKAFGWQPPQYGHLPLILNQNGSKLSKRQDDIQVAVFMEKHTDPNALLNYLTISNSGFTESTQGKTLRQMVDSFSLSLVTKNSTRLQPYKLRELSMQHLERQFKEEKPKVMETTRTILKNKLGITDNDTRVLEDSYIEKMLDWALSERRMFSLDELAANDLHFVWSPPSDNNIQSLRSNISSPVLSSVIAIIEKTEACDIEEHLKHLLVQCCDKNHWSMKTFFGTIRKSLSCVKQGPPVVEMVAILGREETLLRLRRALEIVTQLQSTDASRSSS